MAADHGVADIQSLAQLHRLGEIARGDANIVASCPQAVDDGAHHEHVGAVRQVDPDAHREDGNDPEPYARLPGIVASAMLVLASISESLFNLASEFVGETGLVAVFLLMVAESACIPIPSEATMLFAGFAVTHPGAAP